MPRVRIHDIHGKDSLAVITTTGTMAKRMSERTMTAEDVIVKGNTAGQTCEGIAVVNYDTRNSKRMPHTLRVTGVKVTTLSGAPVTTGSLRLVGKSMRMGEEDNRYWFHIDPSPHQRPDGQGVYYLSVHPHGGIKIKLDEAEKDAEGFAKVLLDMEIDWREKTSDGRKLALDDLVQEVSQGSRILYQFRPPSTKQYIDPLCVEFAVSITYMENGSG